MAYFKKAPKYYQMGSIEQLANISISAATQIGEVGSLTSVQKKAKAVDMFKSLLDTTGFKLDEYDINTIIEAVYRNLYK